MKADDEDEQAGWPHPRAANTLIGHAEAEQVLLESYRSGRLAHAWLIGGAAGIGKATLAYRMARFVLAHPEPEAAAVQNAASLEIDVAHPVARQVAARAHTDLLVLERGYNDSGTRRTVITVEEVRRTVSFFGSTAGQGGWRVCIVDTADELQYPQASNALLKVLEEPPPRALFLLVSHAPGRLLPTIRSRSRRLDVRALAEEEVAQAAALVSGRGAGEPDVRKAAAVAEGSVARALSLLDGTALEVRERVAPMLAKLPAIDPKALHALGDTLNGEEAFEAFMDTVQEWLSGRLRGEAPEPHRTVRAAEAWEKISRSARDVDEFNLERKPFVFSVFATLAEAART